MLFDGTDSPTVAVEVNLGQMGYFTLGVSSLGGPDVMATTLPVPANWSAFPATVVRSVSTRRGRTREDQAVQPGTATVVLDNRSGLYDPDNPSGPYLWNGYTVLSKGLPLRVRAEMTPPAAMEAERLLTSAVWYIDAQDSGSTDAAAVNLGTGGTTLNAAQGTAGNQPKFLSYSGTPYVYLPGVAGNYLSVPDEAALDVTGDIDIRVRVALDDWTPAALTHLVAKRTGVTSTTAAYTFNVLITGALSYSWFDSGTGGFRQSDSTVAPTVSDGAPLWVRVTMDADNGAGGNDVKFYTSSDGASWTQLGATVTTATVAAMAAGTSPVEVGSRNGGTASLATGKFYRAQVLNGIGGTTVLDIDTSVLTSGSATSFLALTGQTVTVNRSTSGRKSVCVVAPVWLFGTDDYMEVADNDLLDFGATDSFTALVVARQPSYTATQVMLAKGSSATTAGYVIRNQTGTPAITSHFIHDGTSSVVPSSPTRTAGVLYALATVRDTATDTVTGYANGVAGTPLSDTTTGSFSNSEALRIGRYSGAGTTYADMEFVAAAVFRRALTATEIATISNYYATRSPIPAPSYTLYSGYVEDVTPDQSLDPTTTITATDALAWLGAQQLDQIVAAYSGDSTSTRAGRILDAVGWSATARSLSGSRIMRDTTYGGTALSLVEEVARCENGRMYATRDGVLSLLPYEGTFSTTERLTLSDQRTSSTVEYDTLQTSPGASYLTNTVNVTMTTGSVVTYANEGSVARFGTYEKAIAAPLLNGTEATALAQSIAERFAFPTTRVDRVEFDALNYGTLWPSILQVDLAERLRIERTTVDGRNRVYGCVVESVNHDISTSGWRVGFDLSPSASSVYFTLGTSVLGGTDQLYY